MSYSINDVIRDVFIDYTKNYMTPDDIIKGAGPVKWSFGSSVFFSWTAITTIGKSCAPLFIFVSFISFLNVGERGKG